MDQLTPDRFRRNWPAGFTVVKAGPDSWLPAGQLVLLVADRDGRAAAKLAGHGALPTWFSSEIDELRRCARSPEGGGPAGKGYTEFARMAFECKEVFDGWIMPRGSEVQGAWTHDVSRKSP